MVAQVGSMKSDPIEHFASTQENPSPGSALTNAAAASRSGSSGPPKSLFDMSGPNRGPVGAVIGSISLHQLVIQGDRLRKCLVIAVGIGGLLHRLRIGAGAPPPRCC